MDFTFQQMIRQFFNDRSVDEENRVFKTNQHFSINKFKAKQDGVLMSLNFQTGVFRVNCIDCLDRTNVVQSMLARVVLETQLVKLGVIASGQGIQMHPDFLSIYRNGKKYYEKVFIFILTKTLSH